MCDYSKRRRRQKQKSVQLEACSIGVCIQNDLAPRQSQVHAESILGCHLDLKPWGVFIAFFFFFPFFKDNRGTWKTKIYESYIIVQRCTHYKNFYPRSLVLTAVAKMDRLC